MNLHQTIETARNVLRFRHMAVKTEKSYLHWIRAFAAGVISPLENLMRTAA